MDLTAMRARDAHRLLADVDAADITNPDLPHRTSVRLITDLSTMLKIATEGSESLQATVDQLREENVRLKAAALEAQLAALDETETAAA